jgi:hypothetical protein
MMRPTPGLRVLRWAAEYEVTAERAGFALLVLATAGLMAAFFLPWWSLTREDIVFVHPTVLNDGFSGWGWLSFAAGLVALALVARLVIAKGISLGVHLDSRMLAGFTVAAGLAEFLGNMLFIAAAPKTEVFIGASQVVSRGVGLDIAMVAGIVLIASGLLMFASNKRHSPAELAEGDARPGTVLLAMATLALFTAFFLRWSSLRESLTSRPFLLVSNGFSGWGWMSFAAWLVMLFVGVWRFAVARRAEATFAKGVVNQLTAWATMAAGVAELIGNALFMATKYQTSIVFGYPPSVGVGFVIAVIAGWVVIASGLLMVVSSIWRSAAASAPSAQSTLVARISAPEHRDGGEE